MGAPLNPERKLKAEVHIAMDKEELAIVDAYVKRWGFKSRAELIKKAIKMYMEEYIHE